MSELTREMILAMEAGREMDAFVAERVMGLPFIALEDAGCPYCEDEMRFCGERSWCSACHEWRYSPYKEYSDDIAAAWEVVEGLKEKYPVFDLYFAHELIRGRHEAWIAVYGIEDELIAEADTAPLAICRAALLTTLEPR